jgi:transposase
MGATRQQYTAEFKREAGRLVTEPGYAVTEAAWNLRLKAPMLRRWKRAFGEPASVAFPGHDRVSPAQEERHRLREENTRLRMERDILKHALGFFASELQ